MNWKLIYRLIPIQKMGWYHESLDSDLEKVLKEYDIHSGSFLDLGTGPGTQAVELAKKGFSVTGTDLSEAAIKQAASLSDSVKFLTDDIVNTKLSKSYDYVFDRGCFHVLGEKDRSAYIENVVKLVRPNGDGFYFLKCLSEKQPKIDIGPIKIPETLGPQRFSVCMTEDLFGEHFDILDIFATVYQGTRAESPKALLVVMRSKS